MSAVGSLTTWNPGDVIASGAVNSNFSALKTSINTALFTDTAGTVSVKHTYSAAVPLDFSNAAWANGAIGYIAAAGLTALAIGSANDVLTTDGSTPGWTSGLLNAHINSSAAIVASKIAAGTFGAGTYSFAGSTISDLGAVTTVDINGGTVDGATVGAASASSGAFTTITASSTAGVTGLLTATAGITSGSNIVSDTDSTDDLGATGTRWANLWVDTITATNTAGIGVAAHADIALSVTGIASGVSIANFVHNHSAPAGIVVQYSGAAPNGTGNKFLTCVDTGAIRAEIRSNGGLANFQSNDADLSDATVKEVYGVIDSAWDAHKAFDIVEFRYLDNPESRVMIGVTAQQIAEVAPDLCGEWGEKNLCSIYTKDLGFYTAKTVQECQTRIEELEAQVAELQAA